jgi:hypothetical protein
MRHRRAEGLHKCRFFAAARCAAMDEPQAAKNAARRSKAVWELNLQLTGVPVS